MLVVGDLLIVSMEMLTTQGLAQAIAVKVCTGVMKHDCTSISWGVALE